MACTSAGPYDPETNRHSCSVTGDDCMFMIPNSKVCVEMYNEGPDAELGDDEETEPRCSRCCFLESECECLL